MSKQNKKDNHPLAINILKLNRYNYDFFNCEEVVFFEYMMVKGMAFKKRKEFFHSAETIRNETGIKRSSLNTIVKKFIGLGMISTEVKGMPRITYFKVHYPQIVELLPKIYQLSENGQLPYDLNKQLSEFLLPLVDNYIEKNNNKNNTEETIKEKEDSESESDNLLLSFNDFLSQFRYNHKIAPATLRFDDLDLFRALKIYDLQTIIEYVEIFFKKKATPKLSKFFEFDPISPNRLVFIEKTIADERNYALKFLDELQDMYISRIRMHNKDDSNKRGKSESKLVVTKRIIESVIQALKVKSEIEISHAFAPYIDAILKETVTVKKVLPYFFSIKDEEYEIINSYLEYYNIMYGYNKNDY
ncbi:hypothetical protein SAMN05192588_1598 [Nonlabens sp. Hel1_33_55]|uniref:hypothetical protein n=1 Tax=Nonlabens sp. Hel1_33_55 TaxID=1336802 RepID=UPI000875EF40|nr:hypothetical protein [Nonlabens sp. Hel1_33_55]SCY19250.1 hypothetical protein SAMN05192588_1598 [Nonlabens sp. Hel1_33_55]